MKKDKLFHLFYSLTPKEVKTFKTFVIGRKPAAVSSLVEILAKSKPNIENKNFEIIRQKAFKKLFPKAKENTQNFRRLVADTLQLLNDFLILAETKANPRLREEILQEQFKNRVLPDLFENSIQENMQRLIDSTERDFNYHRSMVKLRSNDYFYGRYNKQKERNRKNELLEIQKELDLEHIIVKLHYAYSIKILLMIRGSNSDSYSTERIVAYSQKYEDNPIVIFYTDLLELIENPNETDYYKLKKQWEEKIDLFSEHIKLQLFVAMINLAWFSLSQESHLKVVFELYGYGLNKKIVVNSGYIDFAIFNNMVDVGSSIKQFDKVRSFVKEYIPYLREGPDQKENIKNLYEAFLQFGEGKFEEAFLTANYLQFQHQSYGLRSYVLVIKSLYELKKSDSYLEIEVRCNAFKQYLHRKYKEEAISKEKYEEGVNFTKIILQLPFASSSKYSPVDQQQLKEKVDAMPRLISRAWLLEKIGALS